MWQEKGLVEVWCHFVLILAQIEMFVSLKTSADRETKSKDKDRQ